MVLFAAIVAIVLVSPGASSRKATTIRIWADKDRLAAVTKVANQWAASRGATAEVVVKDFGKIRDDLKTVDPSAAPDVIVGAHDWTGELAANGLVVPLVIPKATLKNFPAYALNGFSYGTGVKRLYGAPVAIENVGLIVNTGLVKVPKTFAQLEKSALAFKAKASGNLAIAVQQGANGDAYHMYPFFSGLCGYIFGVNKAGNLNPSNLGIANSKFLKNAPLVDKWNREGLINAKLDDAAAKNAFLSKKAAFWITGPWNADNVKQAGIKFQVIQVPMIRCRAVPFLGVQGFMVTKFSATHGVQSLAKDLVGTYMTGVSPQATLAAANGRYPANVLAGKRVPDAVLKQFGKAGIGGVPMPNIPQMNNVWADLGGAWVNATKGAGSTPARTAFGTAARNIKSKIG